MGQVQARPGRQVAALGVSADAQLRVRILARHAAKVFERARLGGNRLQVAHVEVLLPAHQGGIRPPKGHEYGLIRQQEGHRCKLRLLVAAVLKGEHPRPGKALGLRRLLRHGYVAQLGQAQLLVLLRELLADVAQGDRLPGIPGQQLREPTEIDIGNDAQYQIVHLIEWVHGKGNIPPPGEIIGHCSGIFHGFLLLEHKCVLKSCGKKASQSSRPQTRKIQIIFPRDMCVGKNTSQAASVEF